MADTNWIPGLAVLAAGGLIGGMLVMRARKGAVASTPTDATGTDLERQRDGIYAQIRDLDLGRGAMSDSDWTTERRRLVVEAARTLQAMDSVPAPLPPRRPGWSDRHPRLVGALWGAGIVGFGVALYFGLQEGVKPREEMAATTANPRAAMQARLEQELAAAKLKHEASPDDPALANAYGHLLLNSGQIMPGYELAKRVAATHPDDAEARTHQAIVLLEIGDENMAAQLLDKVIAMHPEFGEALGYRGAVHFNNGEFPEAAAIWERARSADPDMASMLDPLIADAKAGGRKAPSMAGSSPGGSSSGAVGATVSDSDVVGRIEISGEFSGESLVFLFARPTGQDSGPPAAAKRLKISAFPYEFRIGPGDSPMGGPFPPEMTLTARLDRDGNPTTKDPLDLEGRIEGVKPGQTGIVLTLAARGP